MRFHTVCLVLGTLAITGDAAPRPQNLITRQSVNDTSPACLPQHDDDTQSRVDEVAAKQEGFVYGPSLIGQAAAFPNGTLGNARAQSDMDLWNVDREEIDSAVAKDVEIIQKAIAAVSSIQ